MRIRINIACLLAFSALTLPVPPLMAQKPPVVHNFQQPPLLTEVLPNAPATKFLRLSTSAFKSTCNPNGNVKRVGAEVYATLHYVLGKFTINNPDPDDPEGGEDPVELRSYGGCNSGPTLEVLPGNTLHINLINDLSKVDPSCEVPSPDGLALPPGVGCFNTMNIHTHGLHISPTGNSDNVLLSIAPKTEFPYEFNIPNDHPAGTFWYHSHRHGSTATQVASGASGILVVRGNRPYVPPTPDDPHPLADIDTILHDSSGTPTPEKLFLLQQIPYACFQNIPDQKGGPWQAIFTTKGLYTVASTDPNGPLNAPWICPKPTPQNHATIGAIENFNLQMFSSSIWDTNGRFTTVNGVVQPTVTLPAGEIQRWRFVHAGIHDTINLQVVRASLPRVGANLVATSALLGNRLQQKSAVQQLCVATPTTLIPQFEIAVDGLTRKHLEKVGDGGDNESNYMQPGYRSDILLVFAQDGDYCLLDQAAPPSQRVNPATGTGGGQGPSTPQLLAYIHVRGGRAVAGDLQEYIEKSLAAANPQLPQSVRDGLLKGNLSPWAPFLELPAPHSDLQKAGFSIAFPKFMVNNAVYDPDVVNITRQVNTSDDWLLTAEGEPHIFHIHVNPFEIMDVTYLEANGQQVSIYDKSGHCRTDLPIDKQEMQKQYCSMYHVLRDTVFVENGYQVHARTFYDRYIGEFVIHCHILDHEDAGMMLNIEIVPDLNAPGHGLGMDVMHAHNP
ncbi:multicopper oxidase family protein [Terriglobus saanensis]|uniref:Multicopper oxidase type 3 n=1 Tax=Terriglobus saanensis (strain ATCC BAA-1853 / DSM 23119 / SP1PR4) TaxID=401053 RepID=E8V093_TERSS|nr:multicopper oxidase domain-containing protein [Terriglobus saanensis]ADV83311.1 multicopper oxidase type 3 [Terriglobus saanensis SP1PR4]